MATKAKAKPRRKKEPEIDAVTGLPPRPFTQLDTGPNGIIVTTPPEVRRRAAKAIAEAEVYNARKRTKKAKK